MSEVTFTHVSGVSRKNGRRYSAIDIALDGEHMARSFLSDRELAHLQRARETLTLVCEVRSGRAGDFEVWQLAIAEEGRGLLHIGTSLRLADVEAADLKDALAGGGEACA
ncbi:MAG: hypothetical protein LBV06_09635 [Propionibacteriaceae bacterium]|nr:hypothetical protein [Propionibacteriaceae bacterium]